MTSLNTSLRNTGWRRHTPKISSSKSYISPELAVPFEIPFLEKADGEHQSFLEQKNWCLFHWSAENKSWPELLHWSVEDFLTARISSTLSGQWLWIPARQCSVTPLKSDATVSTTERSILHSCWWFGIIFCRSYSFRLLHLGYSVGFGVRRPTTSNLQIYRISKRHSKTSGWRSPLRQFENPLHNGKKWLNAVRKQNEDAIQHIFC